MHPSFRLLSTTVACAALSFGALRSPAAGAQTPDPAPRSGESAPVREKTPRPRAAQGGRITADAPIEVVEGAVGSRVFIFTAGATTAVTHDLALPAGFTVASPAGEAITVRDDTRRVYAHVTGAVAFGEDGRELTTTVRLQGTKLVQTVRTDPGYRGRPIFARVVLQRTGSQVDAAVNADLAAKLGALDEVGAQTTRASREKAAREDAMRATAEAAFVDVPPDYVYDPVNGVWGWHDYCTLSPDSYFSADFRGPCARHDMAYEAAGTRVPAADDRLKVDMDINCAYAYSAYHPNRYSCYGVATTYKATVKSLTYAQLAGTA